MVKRREKLPEPLPIRREIFAYLEKLGGSREKSRIADLWENWKQVVGVELAEQIEGIEEKGHILILKVSDALAMQEVGFQKDEIKEKANEFLHSAYFESVRLTL